MDCRNVRDLRKVFAGCDAVAHPAAEKLRATAERSRRWSPTWPAPTPPVEVALALDVLVLVASTSDVYGNATPPFAEDARDVGPSTTRRWAYAISKLYDEHMALAMAEERACAR